MERRGESILRSVLDVEGEDNEQRARLLPRAFARAVVACLAWARQNRNKQRRPKAQISRSPLASMSSCSSSSSPFPANTRIAIVG